MNAQPTGPELLRGVGLLVDGPTRWGQAVRSNRPGVYVVELPAPAPFAPLDIERIRAWLARVPSLRIDGRQPTAAELADRLRAWWIRDARIVFIGSTERSIGGRIAALQATPLGDARPYAAAHWLLALQRPDTLRFWWSETDAPVEHEDALLDAFAAAVPPEARALPDPEMILPFAVLRRPTGERRPHGITGALLQDAAPARPAVAQPQSAEEAAAATRAARPARAARAPASGAPRAAPRRRTASRANAAPPRAAREVQLSAEGLEAIEAELRELRDVRRPATVRRVAAARQLGDLRENAEYQTSRQELGFIDGRIQLLEDRLRNAVVVTGTISPTATLGSTVVVTNGDVTVEYRLVDSSEANLAAGRLSTSSPVGRALLGRAAGDDVEVVTPGGPQTFRIVEVR